MEDIMTVEEAYLIDAPQVVRMTELKQCGPNFFRPRHQKKYIEMDRAEACQLVKHSFQDLFANYKGMEVDAMIDAYQHPETGKWYVPTDLMNWAISDRYFWKYSND